MDYVYDFLSNKIQLNKDDVIVVGVSAGPDSMCLLYLLNELKKKIGFKIVVAHVNHNVRCESYEEAEFLEKYCQDNNIIFEKMLIKEYSKDNFHNEARNIRYRFYNELIQKYHAKYLMTGHHGDDLIETILMRIARGSSFRGYSGFNDIIKKDNYYIVRPLLHVTKEEIEKFNKKMNIAYRIDKSNFSDKYTRNRYRKNILPFLKKEDKAIHEKFIKFSKILQEYDSFVNNIVDFVMNDVYQNGIIIVSELLKYEELIQKRVIDNLLYSIYQDNIVEIDDKHVDMIMKALYSKKSNITYNLPDNYLFVKEYDQAYFKKDINNNTAYDIALEDKTLLPNGMSLKRVNSCLTNGNDVMRINSRDVLMPLRVRTRHPGDKMIIMNMDGSKKVSDIFINEKIPPNKRDTWPIVVDSNDTIIWIPKVKKSKYNRRIDEEYDIIFKCC